MPMPGIFSAIAGRQKEFYAKKRTEEFCTELPPGVVEHGEKRVKSIPIKKDGSINTCFIRGRFDLVVRFDDGSFGIIDCKTTKPSEGKNRLYSRQLHSYAYALENPAPGELGLSPISKLGLLYFVPVGLEQINNTRQAFQGDLVWQELKRDNKGFLEFMNGLIAILDSETIYPDTCEHCEYCRKGNACLAGKREAQEKGCTCCLWCTYRLKMKDIDNGSAFPLKNPQAKEAPLCPSCGALMKKKSGKYGDFWSCQRFPDCKGTRDVKK